MIPARAPVARRSPWRGDDGYYIEKSSHLDGFLHTVGKVVKETLYCCTSVTTATQSHHRSSPAGRAAAQEDPYAKRIVGHPKAIPARRKARKVTNRRSP
jgi:hypothetical protein